MRMPTILAFCLIAGFGAVQLGGCASAGPTTRSTGQVVDDGALTARVKTAIARDIGVTPAMNVNVTTYRGTVQLSGFVDSPRVAQQAETIARSVEGVQSVENDLKVASGRR